jgi:ethanolamine-phosphate cytidylyltransferase
MSMQERILSILGCKYVSDVLMDAPYVLSDDMLSSLNISAVLMGSDGGGGVSDDKVVEWEEDPYQIPKERGIIHTVESSINITAEDIMDRIVMQQEKFEKKFAKKKLLEDEYYMTRYKK